MYVQDMLGKVMGVDEVIPHKLQKALTFCNKKLGDMRSEERRRVIKVMFTFEFYEFVTISCSYLVFSHARDFSK